MKKFLEYLYYNIFKQWSPIIQLFVFIMIIGIPIEFFGKVFNNGFEIRFSLVWVIFILSIPKIVEKPVEGEHDANI